jgi:hypothetical protein
LSENLKGRDYFGDLSIDGRIIIKRVLKINMIRGSETGFIWLRILTNCGLLLVNTGPDEEFPDELSKY